MGKKLIIKGADFSGCAIVDVATQVSYLKNASSLNTNGIVLPTIQWHEDYEWEFKVFYNGGASGTEDDLTSKVAGAILTSNRFRIWRADTSSSQVRICTHSSSDYFKNPSSSNISSKITQIIHGKKNVVTINGGSPTTLDNYTEYDGAISAKILVYSATGNANGSVDMGQFGYLKITDGNGNVVYNFVPAIDKDGRPCVWETNTDTLSYAENDSYVQAIQ